ncbi:MAG: SprT-like domain-containing protein [Eubacteriales bacterium]|nr:SprT-like domain-containing protein [Eubacteriales bacterium]
MEEKHNERIKRLYNDVYYDLVTIKIPLANNIVLDRENTRAKLRLGSCKKIKKIGKIEYHIELSNKLRKLNDREIKSVIAHELIHTCPDCMNHGIIWKEYSKIANAKLGYNVERCTNIEGLNIDVEEKQYKYKIYCENCNFVTYRMKKTRITNSPENYRCPECRGKIEVTKL